VKELIEYIAKAIVDNPEKVKVTEVLGEDGIIIKLEVDPEDRGKVIGKQGHIARAIRTLLRVAALERDIKATLEIV
jgi:hypothetical protein